MRVLVAADISPTTMQICEFLQNYLKPLGDVTPEVIILHVYEPELDYSEDAPTQGWTATPTSERELRKIFQPLESTCKLQYVVINEALGDSILRRAVDVDMVVMGRRRRSQMQEMVTGSLSQFILHRSPCPVLIVPEPTSRQLAYKMLQIEPSGPIGSIVSPESLARLKVLIGVAQADGAIDSQEKLWLESTLKQEVFPDDITLERLLANPIALTAELAKISDPAQQELTYYAAYLLANADSEYHPEEKRAIDQIAIAFNLTAEKVEELKGLVDRSSSLQNGGKVQPIVDPQMRSQVIEEKILRYATATATLGAFPSPLLSFYTQSAALGLQTTLIAEIAGIWGDSKFLVKPFFAEMVGSLGLVSAWLMALDMAKLVPKVGTSLGSVDAFTATWAMGQTANAYFEGEKALSAIALRQMFKQNRKSAEAVYDYHELAIAEQQQANVNQIKSLTEALRSKKLTSDVYQKRLQQLLVTVKHPQLAF
jgi:nucleotide-binding universal stress UspA family protein/tellurite resistance protein/uncharacterized protein (DUF697 family)